MGKLPALNVSRGAIEVPADRLQGAQSHRELLTEMAFDQCKSSWKMVRPVMKRFTPD